MGRLQKSGEDGWSCPDCGTADPLLSYSSGKMKRCKDCQRYKNLEANAGRTRSRGRSPELRLSRDEFIGWVRSQPRQCAYCRILEHELREAGIVSSIGLPVEALGVDRVDNAGDYESGNIALCCYACNKAKGNVFSGEEMIAIGEAIGGAWRARMAANRQA